MMSEGNSCYGILDDLWFDCVWLIENYNDVSDAAEDVFNALQEMTGVPVPERKQELVCWIEAAAACFDTVGENSPVAGGSQRMPAMPDGSQPAERFSRRSVLLKLLLARTGHHCIECGFSATSPPPDHK